MILFLSLWGCSDDILQEGYTTEGSYYVVFETNPDPIPFKEFFDVTVGVYSDETQTSQLTDIDVIVDATMPAHQHGMNFVPTHEVTDEGFTVASGLEWFMTGTWEMAFYLTIPTGETETALFEMECCQ